MPYNELLKEVISNSNHKNKEIIQELEMKDIHIDKSYLSKLLNGKLSAPREEVSRAIAKICNVDERKLVIEGYIDKAPKEIMDLLYKIKKYSILSALAMISTSFSDQDLKLIEEKVKQEPISDFLISLLDYTEEDMLQSITGNLTISSKKDNFTFQLEEPISFLITNNDMYPIIPQNSKVLLEILETYHNGDIIALKFNNEIIVRYYFMNNGVVSFNALQKDAKLIEYDKENVTILGKVKKVITEI